MHEPWRMVLVTLPDGSTVPTRVWLPPLSGLAGGRDSDGQVEDAIGERLPALPVQPGAIESPDGRVDV